MREMTDPTNPVTRPMIGTANYFTASLCASTTGAPACLRLHESS